MAGIGTWRKLADERGFGMAEIIVSIALLMVVALSMLPVVISALRASEVNVSLTTATQQVSEQMDLARDLDTTCKAVQVFAAETVGMYVTDPRGVVLTIHREAPTTCPSTFPAAFRLEAWVTSGSGANEIRLAEAETRIYIESSGYP